MRGLDTGGCAPWPRGDWVLLCLDTNRKLRWKEVNVADTKKITDKTERKKVKRAARKKAAPKAKRTTPRGSNKQKVKKMVRGQSKR